MPSFQGCLGGPDGLVDYALSRAFRIGSANRNQKAAHCKGCGASLAIGQGYEVHVATGLSGRSWRQFLCWSCLQPVKEASERFPLYDPLPSWWTVLDRDVARQPVKVPLPKEEIEEAIRKRVQTGLDRANERRTR